MKKVIYTCLTGNYDTLEVPECIETGWDYICFSNDMEQRNNSIWQIRQIPYRSTNNVILSRYPKLNPHLVLADYDMSVYVDSNIQISSDYIYKKADELFSGNTLISAIKHPLRDCIYDEAEELIRTGVGKKKDILKNVAFLEKHGFPQKNGLFENNVIYRNHNHSAIQNLSDEWWVLFLKFAKRDQLSLSYLLWKNKIECVYFLPQGFSVWNHPGFIYHNHNPKLMARIKRRLRVYLNKFL